MLKLIYEAGRPFLAIIVSSTINGFREKRFEVRCRLYYSICSEKIMQIAQIPIHKKLIQFLGFASFDHLIHDLCCGGGSQIGRLLSYLPFFLKAIEPRERKYGIYSH